MNRKRKKLTLSSETLRSLDKADYGEVVGGTSIANTDCSAPCTNCTRQCSICTIVCTGCIP